MKIDINVRRRLAFVKYLYQIATEQSYRPQPLCSASILTFHDAVEIFLQLSSEFLDVSKNNITFLEYWEIISPKLSEMGKAKLTQKEAMKRLNKARVGLKHYGNLVTKIDIESFRASTTNFFEENIKLVFDIDISDISLIDLVQNEDTKSNLKLSKDLIKDGKIEDAFDKIALAFKQLIDAYEDKKRGRYFQSPFFIGEDLTFIGHNISMAADGLEGKLSEFVRVVKSSISALQNAVRILGLGIDYRRYVKFKLLVPTVTKMLAGNYVITRWNGRNKSIPKKEDAEFCINFVIESAVLLQDFDFDV